MIGFLDGEGLRWGQADEKLEENQDAAEEKSRLQSLTEEYGFDMALGAAIGIAGPEYAVAYAASETGFVAGEYIAESADTIYTAASEKGSEMYDAFCNKYGEALSLESLDQKQALV